MGLVMPDFGLVFWMSVSFLIVLFILKKFAWKPILQTLKDREKLIADSISSAHDAKEEIKQIKLENQKVLAEAKIERDNLLKEAMETKKQIIKSTENEAKAIYDKAVADAQKEIENQKNKALAEIKDKVAALSVEIAEKILKRELEDENKHQNFIHSLIAETNLN